jgi:Holliday junction DNA helicase RuvB
MHRVTHIHAPQYGAASLTKVWREATGERPGGLVIPASAARCAHTDPIVELKPLSFDARSANELRPATFDQMVGQDRLKRLLRRIVTQSQTSGRPLDHLLLVGQSGTGKTTLAQVTAHELGATVYQTKAPVTHAVLDAARVTLHDGDVLIVDEIHQQVVGDRRGISQAADPEDFYHVMEDRRLPTEGGMVEFPAITLIGCTTDSGLLPEAFLNRFPLSLTLDPYNWGDMATLAVANARQLGLFPYPDGAVVLALASRRNPRQLNTYVRNVTALGYDDLTDVAAREVVIELNGNTPDGLTPDMQRMLKCLLKSRRENQKGNVVYQASVNTIATATGHGRDTKAIALFVEPYLIAEGLVTVTHGGRQLTDAGIKRAQELS